MISGILLIRRKLSIFKSEILGNIFCSNITENESCEMSMWINGIWEAQQPLPTHQKRRDNSAAEEQCLVLAKYFLRRAPPHQASLHREQKRHKELQSHRKMESGQFWSWRRPPKSLCSILLLSMDNKAVSKGLSEVTD